MPKELGRSSVVGKGNSLGVTLPREVRQALGIQKGDDVIFLQDGDKIYVNRLIRDDVYQETVGELLRNVRSGPDLTPIVRRELKEAAKRIEAAAEKLGEKK